MEVSLPSPPPPLGEEAMGEATGEAWATSDLFPPPPRLSTAGESPPKGTFEGHVYCLPTGPVIFATVFQVKNKNKQTCAKRSNLISFHSSFFFGFVLFSNNSFFYVLLMR